MQTCGPFVALQRHAVGHGEHARASVWPMLPARVRDIAEAMTPHLQQPHPVGPGVCATCRNLIDGDQRLCRWCRRHPQLLDALGAITYSVGGHFLHAALRGYKDGPPRVRRRESARLAALLWRYLDAHERCLARAAGTQGFDLITTVPSRGPLDHVVSKLCWPTLPRYSSTLAGSARPFAARTCDASRFVATRPLFGANVLLIDDTWTTGASFQSAAAALRAAGASTVAGLVIGRHLNAEHADIGQRLASRHPLFDWSTCAISTPAPHPSPAP